VAAPFKDVLELLTKPERRAEWDLFYETGHNVKKFTEEVCQQQWQWQWQWQWQGQGQGQQQSPSSL
jgi:hypothetical protein